MVRPGRVTNPASKQQQLQRAAALNTLDMLATQQLNVMPDINAVQEHLHLVLAAARLGSCC